MNRWPALIAKANLIGDVLSKLDRMVWAGSVVTAVPAEEVAVLPSGMRRTLQSQPPIIKLRETGAYNNRNGTLRFQLSEQLTFQRGRNGGSSWAFY